MQHKLKIFERDIMKQARIKMYKFTMLEDQKKKKRQRKKNYPRKVR